MSNDDIHICTSFDTSMAVPVGVLAHSIMQNHKGNRILHLHLLHCRDVDTRSVEKILPNKSDRFVLKFHEVDETGLSRIPLARFPRAAFFRLLIEHYVDANRVLFLDADTLVLRDVSALFDIDQEGFCIAAAQDYVITDIFPRGEAQFNGKTVLYRDYVEKCIGVNNADNYINSGVMLIDMNLWKQQQISKRALEYCESMPPLVFADQDAINWCINGNVRKIDCRWNALVNFSDQIRNPITDAQKIRDIWYRQPWIAHFAGYNKPWKPNDRLTVHDAMYRSMASKSACAGVFWSEYNGLVANLPKKQQIRARTLFARYLMRRLKTAGGSAFRNLIEKTSNRL